MRHFSKKYNKWMELDDSKTHPETKSLYQFGKDYYYDLKKDKYIHKDILDDYLNNTYRLRKNIAKQSAIEKSQFKAAIKRDNS